MKALNTKRFFLFAVPFIFLLGSLLHFAYDFAPSLLTSLIAPINESIWEHTKLVFLPTVLWYFLYYTLTRDKKTISKQKWATSCLVSIISSIISIPLLFYFYTQAFGIELLWVDILILLLATIIGQAVALHFYKYSKGIRFKYSVLFLLIIWIVFIIFTFLPPDLPLFTDFS